MEHKHISLRCEDGLEAVTFSKYIYDANNISYEINVEDDYIGGDYKGFFGRLKRAWRAFTYKPVVYTGIYCEDKDRMRKFLADCISLVVEDDDDEIEYDEYDEEPFPKGQYGEN